MMPCQSACSPWLTVNDITGLCSHCADVEVDVLELYIPIATDILFELTARRFPGSCESTIRPCQHASHQHAGFLTPPSADNVFFNNAQPYYLGPRYFLDPTSDCGSCYRKLLLRPEPVTSILEVKQNGVVLDTSEYRVDDFRWLVRTVATAGPNLGLTLGWPTDQDMSADDTSPNTFSVTYTYGLTPPPLGVQAAAKLTCELAKLCVSDDSCALPPNARNVVRQNISFDLETTESLREGFTGFSPLIDLFISTYNPARIKRAATLYSPGLGPTYRRTNTGA